MAKDLFSQQAAIYARYRPVYPPELFDYILSFVTHRSRAWDCATGNGQAAVELARYFEEVTATDHSEKQLQQATPHPHITYQLAGIENTGLPDNSFDLITVAQAYHWFDFAAFHREVQRVAKPEAIVAIWGYSLIQSEETAVQALIHRFYKEKTGPYWDAERKYVDEHYSTVAFPYRELPARDFRIEVQWTKADLVGYLNTWSSVQHFIKANDYNPVDEFATTLPSVWPDDTALSFYFPLFLRIGLVDQLNG
jgi:ubiquinone/menaquinone biosynthesis C-methylase UbiE